MIDQARQDQLAVQVQQLRAWTLQFQNLLVAAGLLDAMAPDGYGLPDRKRFVHRSDLPMMQDQIPTPAASGSAQRTESSEMTEKNGRIFMATEPPTAASEPKVRFASPTLDNQGVFGSRRSSRLCGAFVEQSRCAGRAFWSVKERPEIHTPEHEKHPLLDLTPLRRSFIQYLALHRKAERTIHANACLPIEVSFIYVLARFRHQNPDQLNSPALERRLYHLIAERNHPRSTVNTCLSCLELTG